MLHSIRLWLLPLLFSALAPGLLAQDKTEPQIKQAVQDDKKPFDIWDNTNATERGDAMFAEVLKTAGGLETWDKIEALRFDLLKIRRVLVNQKTKERKVHHIVPRLCWFDRAGDGLYDFGVHGWTHVQAHVSPRHFDGQLRVGRSE
jgi:hypothetical protein